MSIQIPSIVSWQLTDKTGMATASFQQFMSQLLTQLQTNLNPEGIFIPQQPTTNITTLNTPKSTSAILYDSTTNQFKGCINGVFKIFTLT